MIADQRRRTALNGICPYFTMFPLEFPYSVLSTFATPGDRILDPFCGRGTSNYASRLLDLPSVGVDSSPVAIAIAQAKLANTSPRSIFEAAARLLDEVVTPSDVPTGEFWDWAFHPEVLTTICRLREGLLRALLLGALHGPRPKLRPAYFSNQSQRTYAPKPRYALKYWKDRHLLPEPINVLGIIEDRARRYYAQEASRAVGKVVLGDSRDAAMYSRLRRTCRFNWVITSPPYYGMRTYLSDQWLRAWFLGGPADVDYRQQGQIGHSSPHSFALQLGQVWRNVGSVCAPDAHLVVRFGGINDRKADPLGILMTSFEGTGWSVLRCEPAGSAARGRRQALHFAHCRNRAIEEHDVWAVWQG